MMYSLRCLRCGSTRTWERHYANIGPGPCTCGAKCWLVQPPYPTLDQECFKRYRHRPIYAGGWQPRRYGPRLE